MKKKWIAAVICTLLLAMTGCGFGQSADDLFALPRIPQEYESLTEQLNMMLSDGYTYSAPTDGNNIQPLQMKDLDGDGSPEALAFFRRENEDRALKIYVFGNEDGSYKTLCTMEHNANSVETVYYEDLTGDGKLELIVGWELSGGKREVTVYNVGRDCLPLTECDYTHFTVADIDLDGRSSLVVLHNDSENQPVVEFYGWQSDILTLSYRGILSSTMADISRGSLSSGNCLSDMPALFITGIAEDSTAVTDILVWEEGVGLKNFLADEDGQTTVVYDYRGLLPQDINGDSVVEFPQFLSEGADGAVAWMKYRADGETAEVEETFHYQSEGWYVALPESWWGRVSGDVFYESIETQVTLKLDDAPVLSLFSITGDGRENRAAMGNRFVVKRQTGTVYAAELYDAGAENGMGEDLLRHSFYLTEESWRTQED